MGPVSLVSVLSFLIQNCALGLASHTCGIHCPKLKRGQAIKGQNAAVSYLISECFEPKCQPTHFIGMIFKCTLICPDYFCFLIHLTYGID